MNADAKTESTDSVRTARAADVYTAFRGADMARRRLQIKGHVFRDGTFGRFAIEKT
jgi:hypothetical protein